MKKIYRANVTYIMKKFSLFNPNATEEEHRFIGLFYGEIADVERRAENVAREWNNDDLNKTIKINVIIKESPDSPFSTLQEWLPARDFFEYCKDMEFAYSRIH